MDDIEQYFNYFLQRNVVFSMDSKIIKEGKLILFSQKDYYLTFHLKNSAGEQKKYEIPYPFNIVRKNKYLNISYDLQDISKKDDQLYYRLIALNQIHNSRFYNNKIMFFEKNTLDLSVL